MKKANERCRLGWTVFGVCALLLTGCATNRINWSERVGTYTIDQAMVEFGPPDKTAKLSDGGTVAEWLTRHGYSYVSSPWSYGYYPYAYPPYYPHYFDTVNSPNYYLRLIFTPEGRLTTWKEFAK
jgi:hypothetical protein